MLDKIRKMIEMAKIVDQRRLKEHEDFLQVLKALVEEVPTDVARRFGNYDVRVNTESGKVQERGIELSATDYVFWKTRIGSGVRFVVSPTVIKSRVIERVGKAIEGTDMTPEERKEFISILEDL